MLMFAPLEPKFSAQLSSPETGTLQLYCFGRKVLSPKSVKVRRGDHLIDVVSPPAVWAISKECSFDSVALRLRDGDIRASLNGRTLFPGDTLTLSNIYIVLTKQDDALAPMMR